MVDGLLLEKYFFLQKKISITYSIPYRHVNVSKSTAVDIEELMTLISSLFNEIIGQFLQTVLKSEG